MTTHGTSKMLEEVSLVFMASIPASVICLTKGGLSLTMDVSTTMILKPEPVIHFILANQDIKSIKFIDWVKAKRMLRNFRIKTTF